MHHSLYKYYSNPKWAEAFLNGELLFRSLSYFRDYEDQQVRGDLKEGTSIFRPAGGLEITNHTQGWRKIFPYSFQSTANLEEIFVFCLSRSFSEELRLRFEATACVEILDVKNFCARVEAALPNATFPGLPSRSRLGQPVTYYTETDDCNPRWALPDVIATSKLVDYSWQDEYRLVFSLTDALGFEKTKMHLVGNEAKDPHLPFEHRECPLKIGNLHDICRLRESEVTRF
jgi:hypothetical protein